MTKLRIATWNMQGRVDPDTLLKLVLQPGGPRSTPIHLLALQEVPLGRNYAGEVRAAFRDCPIPDAKDYRVSTVANSQTKPPQTSVTLDFQTSRGGTKKVTSPTPTLEKNDGYMFVYHKDALPRVGGTYSPSKHHTLEYIDRKGLNDKLADRQRALAVKRLDGGEESFDPLSAGFRCLFNRRPLLATFKAGPKSIYVFSWHAPEGGNKRDAIPALKMFAAFDYYSLISEEFKSSGELKSADPAVLMMGDLNAKPSEVIEHFRGKTAISDSTSTWHHVHGGSWDHILLRPSSTTGSTEQITRVTGLPNLIRAGLSDHDWVVADLSYPGLPSAPPPNNIAVAAPSGAGSSSSASTSTSGSKRKPPSRSPTPTTSHTNKKTKTTGSKSKKNASGKKN